MKITALTCPQCGAKLNLKDTEVKTAHCTHCGCDFLLEKENPDVYNTTIHNYGTKSDAKKPGSTSRPAPTGITRASAWVWVVVAIVVLSVVVPIIAAVSASTTAELPVAPPRPVLPPFSRSSSGHCQNQK